MDDMLFQNNAKNNIYVLNTSYNKSYDFDSLSRFGSSNNRCSEFHSTTDSQDSTGSTSLCSLTQSCYSTTAAIQKLFNYSTEHFTNNCSSSRRNNNNQCNGCNNEKQQQQSFSGGGIASRTTSSSNVNSTICAKKKKFLKYLEEEKLRKLGVENLPTTNCERSSSSRTSKTNGVQTKSNSSKSSSELYQEAVEILGLTCTLCDNCRCLDCQSRYFECDDSDFFMDDCYEYIEQDDDMEECSFYKYPIQQSSSRTSTATTTTIDHPETESPQENLLHRNCMEMCDKEIQYDESLFEDEDNNGAAGAVGSDAADADAISLNSD